LIRQYTVDDNGLEKSNVHPFVVQASASRSHTNKYDVRCFRIAIPAVFHVSLIVLDVHECSLFWCYSWLYHILLLLLLYTLHTRILLSYRDETSLISTFVCHYTTTVMKRSIAINRGLTILRIFVTAQVRRTPI